MNTVEMSQSNLYDSGYPEPTEDDAARLYNLGVRYHYVELSFIEGDSGWIDIKTAQNMNWLPYAEVVHRNSSTLVLRLLKNVEQ